MHFIFGGAYNGKTAYALLQVSGDYTVHTGFIPVTSDTPTIIIRHVEQCIQQAQDEVAEAARVMDAVKALCTKYDVIVIGNDISRGVVPLDAAQRFQRDCAGRLYQMLVQHATSVTQIWYGIPQTIKGE